MDITSYTVEAIWQTTVTNEVKFKMYNIFNLQLNIEFSYIHVQGKNLTTERQSK